MPRNYSVKQTVEMLKSNIKKAKELDKSYVEEIEDPTTSKSPPAEPTPPPPPEPVVTQTETTSKDEIIKFERPDDKPTKKWYQFWK